MELERVKRPSSFYLGYFSLSKKFNHIIKDASIFHLKSSDSHRFSYFLIATPLEHTTHQPIASNQFLTCKDFDIKFELTFHLVNSPISFFYQFHILAYILELNIKIWCLGIFVSSKSGKFGPFFFEEKSFV